MKKLFFSVILIMAFFWGRPQWTPTYILEHNQINQGSPVYSACLHNGAIYASTDVPFENELWRSWDHGETWEEVSYPEHTGWFSHMASVDNRLYIANYNNYYAKSMIWYSIDEGVNWVVDTAGMPGAGGANGGAYVIALHAWSGHLIATFGGADLFYMKSFDQPWQLVDELVSTDPNVYGNRNDTIFAVHKYSPDFGQTWINPANVGFPAYPAPTAYYVDSERIYLSGDNIGSHFFIYSDDNGESWQSIDMGQWNNRTIRAIFSYGNHLWLGLDNNEVNTSTDIIYSDNGGLSFTDYSDGMAIDPYGTYYAHTFLKDGNYLFAVNNFQDIYKRETGVSSIDEINGSATIEVYPNPAKSFIYLVPSNSQEKIVRIAISNINGEVVAELDSPVELKINVAGLTSGLYFITMENLNGEFYKSKFLKIGL